MVSRSMPWPGRPAAGWPAVLLALLLLLLAQAPRAERSPRAPLVPAATAAEAEDPNQARVIVRYRAGSELARAAAGAGRAQQARRMAERLALPLADGRALGPRTQGVRGHGLSSRQLAARLAAQPDVEWAVVDERRTIASLPNDPYYGAGQTSITPAVGQWYLRRPDSTLVAAINAEAAWGFSTGSASVTVAVLDTGVRFDHPDLVAKLHPGYDFVSRDTTSRDGDGRDSDASDPGDWSVASDTCGASDSSWHGTQVAGLVGGHTDNGIGMASVGRQVMVLPLRVLGKCGGFDSDIQAAMLWAAGLSNSSACTAQGRAAAVAADCNPNPARVVNLSLGSAGSCTASYQSVLSQLTAAGVVVVVAAGNTTGLAVNSPANCADAIAVAGVRHAGTKVGYSSLGPQVAVAAPAGNCVNETGACLYPLLTTVNSGLTSPGANTYSDSFNASLGTSFASPLVAGTVGLMLSLDPKLTPAQVRSILKATTRPFPSTGAQTVDAVACRAPSSSQQVECYCTTSTCGAGMLDAGAALASVAAGVTPTAVISLSTSSPTAGTALSLDGGGSSAQGGRSLVAYRWAVTAGAALSSLSGPTDARTATLVTQGAGSVTVSLTVTDSAGVSSSVTQTIAVVAAPSVMIAASNSTPTVGSTVTLDSGGSTVGAGRTLGTYGWAVTSGTQLATFSGAVNGSTATLTLTGAGAVTVSLTVTDSAGASRSSTFTITVIAAPNAVIAASNSNPTVGSAITFDGGGSTVGAGRTLRTYSWAITSGAQFAAFSGAIDGRLVTLTTSGAGAVGVSLTVTDSAGASRTSASTIQIATLPVPVINATNASPSVGASVALDAGNSTVGVMRTVSSYRWQIVAGSEFASFVGATDGRAATLATNAAGTVEVSLTVTDSSGASYSSSQLIAVVVAPTAVISASSTTPLVGSNIALDGVASSASTGLRLEKYQWAITNGSTAASFVGATDAKSATLAANAAGAVVISLTVTDNTGTSRSSSLTINVAAPPTSTSAPASSGGGAMGAGWLLGLALAVLALRQPRRQARSAG